MHSYPRMWRQLCLWWHICCSPHYVKMNKPRPSFSSVIKELKQETTYKINTILKLLYKLLKVGSEMCTKLCPTGGWLHQVPHRYACSLVLFPVPWEDGPPRNTSQALGGNQTSVTVVPNHSYFCPFSSLTTKTTSNHLGLEIATINA